MFRGNAGHGIWAWTCSGARSGGNGRASGARKLVVQFVECGVGGLECGEALAGGGFEGVGGAHGPFQLLAQTSRFRVQPIDQLFSFLEDRALLCQALLETLHT